MPPYTTSSAGFSATSGSRLFISMRNGASVIHERALKTLPRAARMTLDFKGASIGASLGAKTPRHFVTRTRVIEARDGGDLTGSPGASNHQQTGLVALHRQQFPGPLVRHDRAQQVLGLLERGYFGQVVVRSG